MTRRCYCTFCGKDNDAVRVMITGPEVVASRGRLKIAICNECVSLCTDIIRSIHRAPLVGYTVGGMAKRRVV